MKFPVKTTCPYCGVGCGLVINKDESGAFVVKGDPSHPANLGRICSKGSALGETLGLDDRLLEPEINGKQVGWDDALADVAGRFNRVIDEHGPDAVAFYVSGQLLTEDYYVANKLMKGFIGSANIDTNSRLCMSSAVAAHKRAFGEDLVPCSYTDIEQAEMIVITGSNTAWCHPVIYQRIVRAKKENPDLFIVNIDPRHTQTSDVADLHLALKPGSDAALFNGLLAWLDANGNTDTAFIEAHTNGFVTTLEAARQSAPGCKSVAAACNLQTDDVQAFYQAFASRNKCVTLFSQGINQSTSGVDKGNAIINCHLLTGRINNPGMGPFSLTGQPNAMGGREVGGLSNQLAAHMEIENPEHRALVKTFWDSPVIADKAGYKAVELFEAVREGKVKAIWIMATNPVVSMPNADKVAEALQCCDNVIVSDAFGNTDTMAYADVKLPALTWGERNGTVTNSERRISRQRPFLAAPGKAKADWWIISGVAEKLGYGNHFDYPDSANIFVEHARLSGHENRGRRQFDISAYAGLSQAGYDALQPTQWPVTPDSPGGTAFPYSNHAFSTEDGRANFLPVTPRQPASQATAGMPFTLNTGRVRDHWHTMTRTGLSPRLSSHRFEPFVEIHPDDAKKHGVNESELAEVYNRNGSVIVRVRVTGKQQKGSLFVPMHWTAQFSKAGRIGSLVAANTDPVSGQPESKHAVAAIRPYKAEWYGFVLTRRNVLSNEYASYWSRSRNADTWRYETAGFDQSEDWAGRARQLLCQNDQGVNWIEYLDKGTNQYRGARFTGEKLESCIFIGEKDALPPRDWLISLFRKDAITRSERARLLSGEPPADQEDTGRTLCSCFNVGEKTILKAIEAGNLHTAAEIGEKCLAGTNCGSCIPELNELLQK